MTIEADPHATLLEDILARNPQLRGDARAMAMMCRMLREHERPAEAFAIGAGAVAMAPGDMEVRDIVRHALSQGVPRFHRAMLGDGPRNRCYAEAIAREVRPGMTVLEIGTGAGLLAMLAARAGATVVTCEQSPVVAAAAAAIVARNGFADRIRVVAKPSSALEIGVDLDAPADLLVSEVFGDTLFGENVVASLTDAKARLLAPGARILPPRAELRCALVEILGERRPPLGEVEGFDLSPFNLLSRPSPRRLSARRSDAAPRSDPASLLAMDFEGEAPFGPQRQSVTLASRGGRVDGIAQWMRIDFGGGVIFENDPFGGEASHWGAPVFELPEPLQTEPGEPVTISARHVRTLLTIGAALG